MWNVIKRAIISALKDDDPTYELIKERKYPSNDFWWETGINWQGFDERGFQADAVESTASLAKSVPNIHNIRDMCDVH